MLEESSGNAVLNFKLLLGVGKHIHMCVYIYIYISAYIYIYGRPPIAVPLIF